MFSAKPNDSFHLWKLRMEAVFETKDCLGVISGDGELPVDDPERTSVSVAQEHYDRRKRKSSAIIIAASGDKPLNDVQKHSKSP